MPPNALTCGANAHVSAALEHSDRLDSSVENALRVIATRSQLRGLSTLGRLALSDFRWLVPVGCAVYLGQPLTTICGLI